MKNKYKIIMLFLGALILGSCSQYSKEEVPNNVKEPLNKTSIPTVFIHGYSGNKKTMKKMMDTFENQGKSEEEMLLFISETGELSVETEMTGTFNKNNPMINLVFENSKSDQWHQAEWIKTALTHLKETYQVEEVNLVGFSMGGISSFLYLETYSEEISQPKVKKLVAIGAPFNEFLELSGQSEASILQSGPKVLSEQLANYTQMIAQVPKETLFLLIGGQVSEDNLSDGTVPLNSSLGIYSLLKEINLEVEYQIMRGNKAKHSRLKRNSEVIKTIGNFLWEK